MGDLATLVLCPVGRKTLLSVNSVIHFTTQRTDVLTAVKTVPDAAASGGDDQ